MSGRRLATVLLLLVSSTALVAPTPAVQAAAPSVTFLPTGTEQQYVVPAGVNAVRVHAVGARGGCWYVAGPRQAAGDIVADVAVSPGQVLYVEVGGPGGLDVNGPGHGGFNGGGDGAPGNALLTGGGGGGASDVRTAPRTAPGSLGTRLVVAGGGGGGGGNNSECSGVTANAGAGGDGTQEAGGAGGTSTACPGVAGTLGVGASGVANCAGVVAGGGGGGGGLYGGGSGGGWNAGMNVAAASGGRGSSGAPGTPSTVVTVDSTGQPRVEITPLVPEASLSSSSLSFPTETLGTSPSRRSVTVSNTGTSPLVVSSVNVVGPQASDFVSPSSTCTAPTPPQGSCQVDVDFAPKGAGQRAATLVLATNASIAPINVALTGTAVSNQFAFLKVTRNETKGTAKILTSLPGPGKLRLRGTGVQTLLKDVTGPKAGLTVRPTPKLRDALELAGQRRVRVKVTYTPTGGDPRSKSKWVRLVLS